MPLSSLTLNVNQGGIGRQAPSRDKVSGILTYAATVPSGFTTTDRVKKVLTLAAAEALGITEAHATFGPLWYHIREYFSTRGNAQGELWIGIYATPGGTYDFTELGTMCAVAQYDIRQVAIYANLLTFASTQITAIQTVINTMTTAKKPPVYVGYCPNFAPATDFSAIADARALTADHVTTLVSQDGSGKGLALFVAKAFTIGHAGIWLGCQSRATVEQSIGNPENFNISDGTENEIVTWASGVAIPADYALLGAVKDKGYQVARKYAPDITGSFFERTPTSIPATSDYAWSEYVRTIDKAIRQIRAVLLPKLNSKVGFKPNGQLSDDSIGYFSDLCYQETDKMKANGEINDAIVLIDPTQNVQSTSTLTITIKIQPFANAEFIVVNIGLTRTI